MYLAPAGDSHSFGFQVVPPLHCVHTLRSLPIHTNAKLGVEPQPSWWETDALTSGPRTTPKNTLNG